MPKTVDPEKIYRLFIGSLLLQEAGLYDESYILAKDAYKKDPKHPFVCVVVANCYLRMDKIEEAKKLYEAAWDVFMDDLLSGGHDTEDESGLEWGIFEIVDNLHEARLFAETAAYCRQYLGEIDYEEDALYPRMLNKLGYCCMALHEYEEAVDAFGELVDIEDSAKAWDNLGDARYTSDDVEGALEAYREALRRDSKLAKPHFIFGLIAASNGEIQRALAEREILQGLGEEDMADMLFDHIYDNEEIDEEISEEMEKDLSFIETMIEDMMTNPRKPNKPKRPNPFYLVPKQDTGVDDSRTDE